MILNETALLGIDVGFSKSRPTTGIAWSSRDGFGVAKTHTDWERRRGHIPPVMSFRVIAVDGPLVPTGYFDTLVRTCEQVLARGAFQKRCKPGSSHFGTGLQLKSAALETARQVSHLASKPIFANVVFDDIAIIEAFPNAFLGVLLSDQTFATRPVRRGRKFDWMYDQAIEAGLFIHLMSVISWDAPDLLQSIETQRDHEKRAAYVCLLTAACAAAGKAEAVGNATSGWIWLPPLEMWAPWAQVALKKNLATVVY